MPIFGTKKQAPVAEASPVTSPAPRGTVSLVKGAKVSLEKNGATIKVTNGWTARGKDYDLKALVRYKNGKQIYVGAANADEVLRTSDGAVRHSGDVRQAGELETIEITWNDAIASVALSSYSALENGRGSFKKYGVFVDIQNGSQSFRLSAADASADASSYTLCFGEVRFGAGGTFEVTNLELYSRSGSEKRVGYHGDRVLMDIGPEGRNK